MVIVMKSGASRPEIDHVIEKIQELGYKEHPIFGSELTVIAAVGDERGKYRLQALESLPGVDRVIPILHPFKLSSKEIHKDNLCVNVSGVKIGVGNFAMIAGPCSVESQEQILETAQAVKAAGANILRGGAFKPRTSPYSFQGLEEEGLKFLARAREKTGLPFVTEVVNPQEVDLVAQYADMLQVGARNMQNFALLKAVGKTSKPILLKRSMMATVEELLMSAEYIASSGNNQIVLCERGIRTFETSTRNTFDVSAIPVIKKLSYLPVIADPSHSTGDWEYVEPVSKAAVAAGADGLMIEVHPHPENALSDGKQSLLPKKFALLVSNLKPYLQAEKKILNVRTHEDS